MIGFVLFVTVAGIGGGYYSGNADNAQQNRPHVFPTLQACEDLRTEQLRVLNASRISNPNLPAFELKCVSLDKIRTDAEKDLFIDSTTRGASHEQA